MDLKNNIGHVLREFRENRNLTQKQLSDLTGIDRTFISHIEIGGRNVSVETLEKLLLGLDLSIQDFFGHNQFKPNSKKSVRKDKKLVIKKEI